MSYVVFQRVEKDSYVENGKNLTGKAYSRTRLFELLSYYFH